MVADSDEGCVKSSDSFDGRHAERAKNNEKEQATDLGKLRWVARQTCSAAEEGEHEDNESLHCGENAGNFKRVLAVKSRRGDEYE